VATDLHKLAVLLRLMNRQAVSGHIVITITRQGGANAVLRGLFLG
jgi:hypothetical protein